MTPKEFEAKWKLTRAEMAMLLSVPKNTLDKWMSEKSGRSVPPTVIKYLEVINRIWERWKNQNQERLDFPPEVADLYEVAIDRQEIDER